MVVGDPERADEAAKLLEGPEVIWNNREYRAYSGLYHRLPVTVCSHGVGSTGATFCFQQLIQAGAKTIIRAGTCGGMVAEIDNGSQVIATGAIRADGASNYLIPVEYPALADRRVILALENAAREEKQVKFYTGVVLTVAVFYPTPFIPSQHPMWQQAGAVGVEMELAPLLVLAGIHGLRAGGIFTTDSNMVRDPDPAHYNPFQDVVTRGKAAMLRIALNALVDLGENNP